MAGKVKQYSLRVVRRFRNQLEFFNTKLVSFLFWMILAPLNSFLLLVLKKVYTCERN